MNTEAGPLEILQHEPISVGQWYVVAICIGILALDGYDVLSIAFAAPVRGLGSGNQDVQAAFFNRK